jgi:hypothetical protein
VAAPVVGPSFYVAFSFVGHQPLIRFCSDELTCNFVSIILEENEDVGQNQNVREAKLFENVLKCKFMETTVIS